MFPPLYNRKLLLHDDIRATITKKEIKEEKKSDSKIVIPRKSAPVTETIPKYDTQYVKHVNSNIRLNFSKGTGELCLNAIIQDDQLQQARENIAKQKDDGKTLKERLSVYSKLTAVNLFLSRDNRIGQECFQYRRKKLDEKKRKIIQKVKLAKVEWQQCKEE